MTTAKAEGTWTVLLSPSFVYVIDPIDDWTGWMEKSEFLSSVWFDEFATLPPTTPIAEKILHDFKRGKAVLGDFENAAMEAARTVGWEGDIRQGPYFSALPPAAHDNYCYVPVMMAFKQHNNGTTFIATPYALPWIERDALAVACVL